MRRIFLVLAVTALLAVVATPAMADGGGDDCDWWGCRHHNDCDWWRCNDDNDFDRSRPFFFPFFNDDCKWEFEKGWFWGPWGWQWGTWELDC
jgi:hypothetical protein